MQQKCNYVSNVAVQLISHDDDSALDTEVVRRQAIDVPLLDGDGVAQHLDHVEVEGAHDAAVVARLRPRLYLIIY